jgi:hypothetical protein
METEYARKDRWGWGLLLPKVGAVCEERGGRGKEKPGREGRTYPLEQDPEK